MNQPAHFTLHARARAQQRSLPPIVDALLTQFGEEVHVGNGRVRLLLTKRSTRHAAMISGALAKQCQRFRGAYQIESLRTGKIVTTGWAYRRIKHH